MPLESKETQSGMPDGPPYFTPPTTLEGYGDYKSVTGQGTLHFKFVPCKCGSWWCAVCAPQRARELQQAMIVRLAQYRQIRMLHITVDPTLFHSPVEALQYLRQRRAVSVLMQDIRRSGYLYQDHYAGAMELQPGTGFPHFHLLIDSGYIPCRYIQMLWGKHRPATACAATDPRRPAFGMVRLTRNAYRTPAEAAWRAVRYAFKMDQNQVPSWILDSNNIRRIITSHGFWPRATASGSSVTPQATERRTRRPSRSTREIVAGCQTTVALMQQVEGIDCRTGEVKTHNVFMAEIAVTPAFTMAMSMRGWQIPPQVNQASSPRNAVIELEHQLGCPIEVVRWPCGVFSGKEAA